MPNLETTMDHVKFYISMGWYIGPTYWIENKACTCHSKERCKSAAKHPIQSNGYHDFTNDIELAESLWTQYPKAGIGVDLERSEILFVGPDSVEWKNKFEAQGLHHGAAIMDSGGGEGHLHYYFKRPPGCPKTRINKPKEYDIQASGIGVLPPSPHVSGKTRTWLTPIDRWIPEAPPIVVEQLKEKGVTETDTGELPPMPTRVAPTALPVRLSQEGVERWVGSRVDYKPNSMEVDTSMTIHNMARELAKAGATAEVIFNLLESWALTQGYGKYANRPIEYWRSACKAVEEAETLTGTSLPATSSPTEEIQIYTLKDLLATTFDKPNYFIDPMVPSSGIILLAGASGSLKTAVIADLFLSIIEQRTWLDYYQVPPLTGKILYLDGEVGVQAIQKRLLSMGAPPSEDLEYIYRRWRIENPKEFQYLKGLATANKYSLIIVDSISAMHMQEERNDTTVLIMQLLRDIADAADCPMVVLANFNKSTSEKRELLERISGPSVYRNKSSAIITLRRVGGKKIMKARMQLQKNWLGQEGEARTIELKDKDGTLRFVSEPWEPPSSEGDDDGTEAEESRPTASPVEVARLALFTFLRDYSNDEDISVRELEAFLHSIKGVSLELAKQVVSKGIVEGVLSEPERKGRGGMMMTRRLL